MYFEPFGGIPETGELQRAIETALRWIPPAFPLEATVAVNPFLGHTADDLATVAARFARLAGVRTTPPRAWYLEELRAGRLNRDDLAAALAARRRTSTFADVAALEAFLRQPEPELRALPTVAELAARATGRDWPEVIARSVGLWAAAHFDRGLASWRPDARIDAFRAWRDYAVHDLTPEIFGLVGFCSRVAAAPDTSERAIRLACARLGVGPTAACHYFFRLLVDLGGWAHHARWLLWQAELEGRTDRTLQGLLAIRLLWEEALLAHVPAIEADWQAARAAYAAPIEPSADDVAMSVLQDAAERAFQRHMASKLDGRRARKAPPTVQAVFCIDVRSEIFRRALETVAEDVQTLGFAGFFGLKLLHRAHLSDEPDALLPVLLLPDLTSTSHLDGEEERRSRIAYRALRAWDRFKRGVASAFPFVEAWGPAYAWKLLADGFGLRRRHLAGPPPRFEPALPPAVKGRVAASVLQAMGLTRDFAPIVLLVGHGAETVNNPHESAYHCGACGGRTGEVSARLLAALLNDPETREALAAEGIVIPAATRFIGALHNTTTDEVDLLDPIPQAAGLAQLRSALARAAALARAERAMRLPRATPATLARRARDWAEVRPEWGLAGCAAFIAAPRAMTAGRSLAGEVFLHDYDWRSDHDFSTLELILTAPVVVASWINLQYYGSAVAPELFGAGNKLLHNVVGGIGVVEGNGGRLRVGLPWQAVHDGERLVHRPLRLSVYVEAPAEAIVSVLQRHPEVAQLFDNGWLHLFALGDGVPRLRYRPGGVWEEAARPELVAG